MVQQSICNNCSHRAEIRRLIDLTLNTSITALMARHLGVTFPVCALAVLQNGRVLMDRAWGHCEGHEASSATLFDVASISKLFTTTAFLACVSKAQIQLDDPLVRVLPAFGQTGLRPIEGGQDPHTLARQALQPDRVGQFVDPCSVTFRHLLTHTSGLPAWRDVFLQIGPVPTLPQSWGRVETSDPWRRALSLLYAYPFIDHPGHRVVYSDIGWMLLGHALEVVTGQSLAACIQSSVLKPLGLRHTMFNPVQCAGVSLALIAPTELDLRWRQRRVWGEVHDENACALGGVAGHAGLFSTAMDIAQFGHAWLKDPLKLGVDEELSRQALSEQACTDDVRRGLGFVIKSQVNASAGDLFSPRTFGHTGFTGTTLWVDPDRDLVVSCLTNGVYMGRAAHAPHTFRRELHDLIAQSI